LLKSYTFTPPALQQVLYHVFKSHFMDAISEESVCAAIPNAQFLTTKIQRIQTMGLSMPPTPQLRLGIN
jgi:hypothetical protein